MFGKKQDPNGAYAAVIPKFINELMNHKTSVINGDGSFSRDFTYIDNVVAANILCLKIDYTKIKEHVYNIAYGEKTTIDELFNNIKNCLSKKDSKILNLEPEYGPKDRGTYRIL